MELLKYLFLGIVQGITEVFPISSSGHVELAKLLLDLQVDEGILFLILLNTGSLIVFLILYSKQILKLIRAFFLWIFFPDRREEFRGDFRFCLKIIVSTVPAGITGFLFSGWIDQMLIQYGGLFSGIGLLVTATVLVLIGQHHFTSRDNPITFKDAVVIGLVQALTPLPGVSRSGMTTVSALRRGVGLDPAIQFVFLLYLPVSFGSLILLATKISQSGLGIPSNEYLLYYLGAFFMAVLFTALAFRWIRPIFRNGKLKYFGYYCYAAGLLSVILFLIKNPH
jgi:undecaprenyl-diphosphatase